jgi:hypothetical protein
MALCALVSCRKDEVDTFDGPSLNDLVGPFSIVQDLTLSHAEIDFAAEGNLVFSAELSKNTDWIISITGLESGAHRTIIGSNRIIGVENAAWNGGANTFPAFELEEVAIELTFPNEAEAPTINAEATITGIKLDDGYLLTSFEEGLGSNWTVFNQTTVNGSIVCGDGEAAKGDCHYRWTGAVGWDWAIGSVMVKPDEGTFGLPASANNLYFNLALKALENVGPTSSFILFWFDEDENGDGVFNEGTEDRFIYEYWSQGSEWDLISRKYSDLQFDAEGNQVETNGNGLPEPSKLVSVNIFFLADPEGGNASALVDHLIFTTDNPYTP